MSYQHDGSPRVVTADMSSQQAAQTGIDTGADIGVTSITSPERVSVGESFSILVQIEEDERVPVWDEDHCFSTDPGIVPENGTLLSIRMERSGAVEGSDDVCMGSYSSPIGGSVTQEFDVIHDGFGEGQVVSDMELVVAGGVSGNVVSRVNIPPIEVVDPEEDGNGDTDVPVCGEDQYWDTQAGECVDTGDGECEGIDLPLVGCMEGPGIDIPGLPGLPEIPWDLIKVLAIAGGIILVVTQSGGVIGLVKYAMDNPVKVAAIGVGGSIALMAAVDSMFGGE